MQFSIASGFVNLYLEYLIDLIGISLNLNAADTMLLLEV